MYKIDEKNNITLIRGDTFICEVEIYKDDEVYTPASGDVIRFALKHEALNANDSEYIDVEPLIIREIPADTCVLRLDPADTKGLGFGRYVYDIEITMENGTVDTFIHGSFTLAAEVY